MISTEELTRENVSIRVENIGGIDEAELEVSPGVTALTGRNTTNRTSLLQATMAALGSDHVSLKGDVEEGHVELTIGDTTYTRTLTWKNGTVTTSGEPYLDDPTVPTSSCSCSNPTRRAMR